MIVTTTLFFREQGPHLLACVSGENGNTFVHLISVIAVLPPTQPPKMNKLIENLCWIFLEHSYSIVFYLRFLKRHSLSMGNEDIYLPHLIMDCIYVRPHWNEDTVAMITMPMSFRFLVEYHVCHTNIKCKENLSKGFGGHYYQPWIGFF